MLYVGCVGVLLVADCGMCGIVHVLWCVVLLFGVCWVTDCVVGCDHSLDCGVCVWWWCWLWLCC